MDPRSPKPEPRVGVLGPLAAGLVATILYVVALRTDHRPGEWISVPLFVTAPVLAVAALGLIWGRRHESLRPDLSWFASGLAAGIVTMIYQMLAFPAVAADGGPLHTSDNSRAALYVLFHVWPAFGALLGVLGAHHRFRAPFLVHAVVLSTAIAVNLIPLPVLIDSHGMFMPALVIADAMAAVFVLVTTFWWMGQAGLTAIPIVAWVGISQSLAFYDLVFSAIGGERFSAMWWASLTMRVATYAVLLLGSARSLLRHLHNVEDYAASELNRREQQLGKSLETVSRLLLDATRTSATLQEQLLPRQMFSGRGIDIAALYAGAGANKQIGGDWYDAIPLPDGGLALIIGDVEGHDLVAAAIMGQVRAAVHSYALEGHPPSILLRRVNRYLIESGTERFVALAYVQLYPGDRLMTIAVAGNPVPVFIPQDGTLTRVIPVEAGPPLGLESTYDWPERTMLVPAGMDLAMFTDGVYHKNPWDGEDDVPFPFALPPSSQNHPRALQELAGALLSKVTEDDAAVVVARVSSKRRATADRILPTAPISAPIARKWLEDLLAVWIAEKDLQDSPIVQDRAETAVLLLTELVTNALRHGEDTIRVRASVRGSNLRLAVRDTSHRMPTVQSLDPTETSGRGLRLVDALSDDWGVKAHQRGKTVWFDLDLTKEGADDAAVTAYFDLGGEGVA